MSVERACKGHYLRTQSPAHYKANRPMTTSTNETLSKLSGLSHAADDAAVPPLPKYPWKTRVLLPGALLLSLLALFAFAANEAIWPATDVRVVPVVLQP